MVDKIAHEMNKNYVIGVFLNLSKAFDTTDHKILVENKTYMA